MRGRLDDLKACVRRALHTRVCVFRVWVGRFVWLWVGGGLSCDLCVVLVRAGTPCVYVCICVCVYAVRVCVCADTNTNVRRNLYCV